MGLKGFSYGLTGLALGCGLLAAGRLPSASNGQPVLLVARRVVAGAVVGPAGGRGRPSSRQAGGPLWASLVVLAVYASALPGGLSMLAGLG